MRKRPLLLAGLLISTLQPAQAEITYIGLEEAEDIRLCILYKNKLEETRKSLRQASVAGGSMTGTTMEANAKRTKLRFQRDFYERKIEESCADVDTDSPAADAIESVAED